MCIVDSDITIGSLENEKSTATTAEEQLRKQIYQLLSMFDGDEITEEMVSREMNRAIGLAERLGTTPEEVIKIEQRAAQQPD